jgi:hypothetical protein
MRGAELILAQIVAGHMFWFLGEFVLAAHGG